MTSEFLDDAHDAASLREALALLGEWESELDVLWAPATTPPPQSPLTKKPRPTEYRLRRNARDAKLSQLRDEAQRLASLLVQEKRRIAEREAESSESALTRECEAMVRRQKHQRVAAEQENQALLGVLDTHHELAQRMHKLVSKSAMYMENVMGPHDVRPVQASLAVFNGPTLGIPQSVRHLDSRMDEAGMVFSSGRFAVHGDREFQQVSFRDLGFDGLQVEFALSWVVPFSVAAVERVLWAHMTCTKHHARATDHQFTHSSSDLLCSRFVSEPMTSPDQPNCNHGQPIAGTTHGQAAVRRYPPGPDGTRTIVLHMRARIFHDNEQPKGDMHGDGWFQVEPVPGLGTAATPHVSRIKWCRRVTGRPIDHDVTSHTTRAQWVHSVVTGPMRRHWENSLTLNMASIENALLPATQLK